MTFKKLLLLLVLAPSFLCAQDFYKPGTFIIKGYVKNFTAPTLDFGMTTYFNNKVNSVIVKPDGSFEQEFAIQNRQNVYFYLNNDAVGFTIVDKDTIYLEWDEDDFKNSFSVRGNNPVRTVELQNQLKLYHNFRKPLINLNMVLNKDRDKLTRDKKFTLINKLYNKHVQAVFDSSGTLSENSNYLITSLYFVYSKFLRQQNLIPKYRLDLNLDTARTYASFEMSGISSYKQLNLSYKQLNESWFVNVPEYRAFIYDYIRFYKPFNSYQGISPQNKKEFNPTLDEYHLAQSNIFYLNIKDWFITKSIMDGFKFYSFTDVEKVYQLFIDSCKTPYLKDTLQKYYTAFKRLKPGNSAPDFSLKNEKGQVVSLSDFKGKVVYIDFWGVGCGPCIYDIKNSIPGLHKKYKNKEIVFINICVDSKEKEWKAALAKYQLQGVNLIAEGWSNNPVCKAYYVSSIPHYILVDKSGKISNNNAPRAYELNRNSGENEIDLLSK